MANIEASPTSPPHLVRVHWSNGCSHEDTVRGQDQADAVANARVVAWSWDPAAAIEYLGLGVRTASDA